MYKRFFKDSYCPYCDYNLNSILFVSNLNYNSNVYNTWIVNNLYEFITLKLRVFYSIALLSKKKRFSLKRYI